MEPIEQLFIYGVLVSSIAGLVYALLLIFQINRYDEGTEDMRKVNRAIREGADAYLRSQFKSIIIPLAFLSIFLFYTGTSQDISIALGRVWAFLMGSLFSGSVGYIGMTMAVKGNVRVANAARKSFNEALKIAYRSGTITGMLTDGLGLLGGVIILLAYGPERAYEVLLGYGFGGSLIALFMRVGGGIYTKSADVGADIVGKVEEGIPEDDPRNPAVIADLVGDNVGDCAGMAADIFESYEVSIVAAMILGLAAFPGSVKGVVYPLVVRAIGIFSSIISTYFVSVSGDVGDAMGAIKRGYNLAAVISISGFSILAMYYMGDFRIAVVTFWGIILAVLINYITDYYTSQKFGPVKEIISSTQTGAATTILSGLAVGYESTVIAILAIAGTIIASSILFIQEGFLMIAYGIALAGIGFLTLTGNNVSMDTFGPIVDNAQGLAEMVGLEKDARKTLEHMDSVGNTTKAITKGIAIGSAVLAAISLYNDYFQLTKLTTLPLIESHVFVLFFIGLLIGGAIPFLFSAIAIRAVSRGAFGMIREVRRQFRENPDILKGKAKPDYGRCVAISTLSAQKELLTLGAVAILAPIVVGFSLHEFALAGFLAGMIVSGQLLAVFMANAGGAWDNAKKAIEDGLFGGKGSDAHKAGVVGDTVGDPLKDTAGPALNPMLKVINLITLLVAPVILLYKQNIMVNMAVAIPAFIIMIVALWYSKRPPKMEE
jgi:K(+)-stimulated pyrophosphate-energized sodium pump